MPRIVVLFETSLIDKYLLSLYYTPGPKINDTVLASGNSDPSSSQRMFLLGPSNMVAHVVEPLLHARLCAKPTAHSILLVLWVIP